MHTNHATVNDFSMANVQQMQQVARNAKAQSDVREETKRQRNHVDLRAPGVAGTLGRDAGRKRAPNGGKTFREYAGNASTT